MKSFLFSLLSISPALLFSQSIDFQELTPSNLTNARNGAVAMGDIDSDGDLDVFVMGNDANTLKSELYLNDGEGNYELVPETPFEVLQFGHAGFADVDGDNDLDLLITGSNFVPSRFANLYLNDGDGNFTLDVANDFQPTTEGEFEFADIDNDGDMDLFLTGYMDNNDNGFSGLYINNGTGVFEWIVAVAMEPMRGSSVEFFDYDGDEDLDLLQAGLNDADELVTQLYENDGDGNYTFVMGTPFIGIALGDIDAGDVDGDGDLDIMLNGESDSGYLIEYYRNEDGEFVVGSIPNLTASFAGTVDLYDFDNDNDLDVFITGAGDSFDHYAELYTNDGSGNFEPAQSLIGVYLSSIAIGDIDGDNDSDMIVVGISSQTDPFLTRIYLNEGPALSAGDKPISVSPFSVYPNPTQESLAISSNLPIKSIRLSNASGQEIYTYQEIQEIDMSHLEKGLYYLLIEFANGGEVSIKKVVKL